MNKFSASSAISGNSSKVESYIASSYPSTSRWSLMSSGTIGTYEENGRFLGISAMISPMLGNRNDHLY
jgi:hypothetical protein